uniref:Uncharacterized protein n=1 Tax=Arundo donax TaxID=35708 RepID=A0A0A9CK54_ARUDO
MDSDRRSRLQLFHVFISCKSVNNDDFSQIKEENTVSIHVMSWRILYTYYYIVLFLICHSLLV